MKKQKRQKYQYPFQLTLHIIESKWKLQIVHILSEEHTRRYGELKKAIIPQITHKMLVQSLRGLERDDIVMRHIYPQVPPRVEYALTENGKRLRSVIDAMNAFGVQYTK